MSRLQLNCFQCLPSSESYLQIFAEDLIEPPTRQPTRLTLFIQNMQTGQLLHSFSVFTKNKNNNQLEGLSRAHISPTDLDLTKFNHLVPCGHGQGYDWPNLVTIGLGARKLFTNIPIYTYIYCESLAIFSLLYIYIYNDKGKDIKDNLPSLSVEEVTK